MVNYENDIEIYWKDSNDTNATPNHPTNEWVKANNITIPNVHPSTSMGYTDFLTYQADDFTIRGYNISWSAENTTFAPDPTTGASKHSFIIDDQQGGEFGVPGTHLSITALNDVSGGSRIAVFFQTEGDDVTQYSRDATAGTFFSAKVPI